MAWRFAQEGKEYWQSQLKDLSLLQQENI